MPYLFPEEEPTVMEQCSQCEVYFPEDDAYGTSEKPLCTTCACEHDWSGFPGAFCLRCGTTYEYDEEGYDPAMDAPNPNCELGAPDGDCTSYAVESACASCDPIPSVTEDGGTTC